MQGGFALIAIAQPFPLTATEKFNLMTDHTTFDVIIIGGSYAGLSAAMALGRSLRRVLIIDSGSPCNRQTPHSHNFLTQDGERPAEIARKAREQVLRYGTVKFYNDLAVSGRQADDGFRITTQTGKEFTAAKLILATGIRDEMPSIKGFSECWGTSVIHCPYCHGYEFRGQKTAIMAGGDRAFHVASLVSNLTDDLTILDPGGAGFSAEQSERLRKHHIPVIGTAIEEIGHENGHIRQVVFADGSRMDVKAMYAAIPFTQHSEIPVSLGCELTGLGHIKVDMTQRTTVKGVFACGDNAGPMRSVASAVAAGNLAGAMVNHELTEERF